ncbi:MAG TPA: PqqD family protein [Chloroflexota bacterium]|nr:PqqD family protein [Chloroflexota bacterium]
MHDSDRPRRAPGFQIDDLDGEAVLFHPVKLTIMHLNRSAALIWRLCDGQRTLGEIRDLLSDAYPDAAPEIQTDVQRVLQMFLDNESIAIVRPGPVDDRQA